MGAGVAGMGGTCDICGIGHIVEGDQSATAHDVVGQGGDSVCILRNRAAGQQEDSIVPSQRVRLEGAGSHRGEGHARISIAGHRETIQGNRHLV